MTSLQKPVSRAAEKRAAKREAEKRKRNVYSFVSNRDGFKCRACGRVGSPNATSMLDKLHHHEIKFRSVGGQIVSSNVVLLDAECHADAQAHRLIITGDADGSLTFENAAGKVWVR